MTGAVIGVAVGVVAVAAWLGGRFAAKVAVLPRKTDQKVIEETEGSITFAETDPKVIDEAVDPRKVQEKVIGPSEPDRETKCDAAAQQPASAPTNTDSEPTCDAAAQHSASADEASNAETPTNTDRETEPKPLPRILVGARPDAGTTLRLAAPADGWPKHVRRDLVDGRAYDIGGKMVETERRGSEGDVLALRVRGQARLLVWDSFFAEEDTKANRREYLGVAAPGRSLKRVMLNVYTTLLGAAARCWNPDAPLDCQQAADPYMTLVGYFNSLRELSGTTRLVEDQVHAATQSLHERKPVDFDGPHPWLAARKLANHPVELTSRESTDKVKRAKSRLAWLAGRPGAIDVVLASNMIGTGIDIDRLGLMVIAGQPKSTSDYIQGSSRVGRDDKRPGLVVTLYSMHKPRDRSHFEHFGLYHDTFYRAVESKSVTPFSLPALERGLTGVLMATVRLENQAMTPKDAVLKIEQHRRAGDEALEFLVERARAHRLDGDEVAINELAAILSDRGKRTLDDWGHVARNASTIRVYSDFDIKDRRGNGHEGNPLLRTLEQDLRDPAARSRTDDEARFAAPTSMRDVEPVVHLWVRGRH